MGKLTNLPLPLTGVLPILGDTGGSPRRSLSHRENRAPGLRRTAAQLLRNVAG